MKAGTVLLIAGGAGLGVWLWSRRSHRDFLDDLCAGALGLSPETCGKLRETVEGATKAIGGAIGGVVNEPLSGVAESRFGAGVTAVAEKIFDGGGNRTVNLDCTAELGPAPPGLSRDSEEHRRLMCQCARIRVNQCQSDPNNEELCPGITWSFASSMLRDCAERGLT